MSRLRRDLAQWNKQVFGHVDNEVPDLQKKVDELELLFEQQDLDDEQRMELADTPDALHSREKQRDSLWHQKSRLSWRKLGDRNTRYFHTFACNQGRKKNIHSIKVGDSWMSPVWRNIIRSQGYGGLSNIALGSGLQLVMGDGSRIRFWYDAWTVQGCLKDRFHKIFLKFAFQDASLRDVQAAGAWPGLLAVEIRGRKKKKKEKVVLDRADYRIIDLPEKFWADGTELVENHAQATISISPHLQIVYDLPVF
ncbi:hypothetical protein Tsubulata_039825 [Turnera subulata]|uniref:Uncharacterized protein n=1 Tax=Turnera subulata TaxID=218843 RepID=A0A9Q0G232_9ROSI|nr:hypothetical protein Tsubulata_039825 [Turnera subulata]